MAGDISARRVLLDAGLAYASEDQVDLLATLRAVEASLIDWALARTGGCKAQAAQLLGIRRTTLVEKLRRRGEEPGAVELMPETAAEGGSERDRQRSAG